MTCLVSEHCGHSLSNQQDLPKHGFPSSRSFAAVIVTKSTSRTIIFHILSRLFVTRDTTLSTSLQLWIKSTEWVSHRTASHNAHLLLELYFTLWNEVMKEILSNLYSDQQEIKFFSNHGRLICIAVRLKVSEKLKKRVVSSCCLALVIGVLPWINKYKKKGQRMSLHLVCK